MSMGRNDLFLDKDRVFRVPKSPRNTRTTMLRSTLPLLVKCVSIDLECVALLNSIKDQSAGLCKMMSFQRRDTPANCCFRLRRAWVQISKLKMDESISFGKRLIAGGLWLIHSLILARCLEIAKRTSKSWFRRSFALSSSRANSARASLSSSMVVWRCCEVVGAPYRSRRWSFTWRSVVKEQLLPVLVEQSFVSTSKWYQLRSIRTKIWMILLYFFSAGLSQGDWVHRTKNIIIRRANGANFADNVEHPLGGWQRGKTSSIMSGEDFSFYLPGRYRWTPRSHFVSTFVIWSISPPRFWRTPINHSHLASKSTSKDRKLNYTDSLSK